MPLNVTDHNQPIRKETSQTAYLLFNYVTFCNKCPSHNSWSNSKVKSAPTVMYCILSSLTGKHTEALCNERHPLLTGCLAANIYKVGTTDFF